MENKLKELSDILVNYSIHVEKGEKVLINSFSIKAKPLIVELVKSVAQAGAIPFVRIEDQEINRVLLENTTIDRMNEVNPHLAWAKKIIKLSNIFGVFNEGVEFNDLTRI